MSWTARRRWATYCATGSVVLLLSLVGEVEIHAVLAISRECSLTDDFGCVRATPDRE